jgi:hypothetical protein
MLTRAGTTVVQLAAAAEAERVPGWEALVELAGTAAGSSSSNSNAGSIFAVGSSMNSGSSGTADSSSSSSPADVGPQRRPHGSSAVATAVYNCRYRPYLKKMEAEVAELRRDEALRIPPGLDYAALQLSAEDREKLSTARPASLAAAQRIPGVTPSALLLLLQHVRKRQPRSGGSGTGRSGDSSGVAQAAAAEAGSGN